MLAAKKLVEVNHVEAVLGTWASAVTLAVAPIFNAANIIHMTNAGTSDLAKVNQNGLIFRFSAPSARTGESLAQGAISEDHKTFAIMAINNASGREVAQGAKATLLAGGRQVLSEVIYEPNQPSYRSEIQAALAKNPEALIMGCFLPDLTIILRETLQSGANVKFFVPAWAVTPKLIETIGPATEGIMTADYVSALDSDAFAQFSKRFKEVVGSDPKDNYYAACAYDMVQKSRSGYSGRGPERRCQGTRRDNASGEQSARHQSVKLRRRQEAPRGWSKDQFKSASGPLDFDEKGDVKALFKLSVIKGGQMTQLRVLK